MTNYIIKREVERGCYLANAETGEKVWPLGERTFATRPAAKRKLAELTNAWMAEYDEWRHGGWYVTNIHYPNGGCGCVSRNFKDGKWRIIAENTYPGDPNDKTYPSRDAAAEAERELVLAQGGRG